MADDAEVAIESALLDRYRALVLSPVLPKSYPLVKLVPPVAAPGVGWLRASYLPAPSFAIGIADNAFVQHYGIFQIDVFHGQGTEGSGELAPGRIASRVVAWFKRGTKLTKDGFVVECGIGTDVPRRGQAIPDDPWVFIPVTIPYRCFARPTT